MNISGMSPETVARTRKSQLLTSVRTLSISKLDAEVAPTRSSGSVFGNDTDENLLAEIGSGSKIAAVILLSRYRSALLSIASRILRDPAEAEDLYQEAFLWLMDKAGLFDADKGTAASWLVQVVYHRAMNRRKYLTRRNHYAVTESHEATLPSTDSRLLIDGLIAKTLLDGLRSQLSEDQRITLELHFWEGYTLNEIAERLGQTVGNTRHHFYRGLEKLRARVFSPKNV